jgi:hypothetical protein
MAKHFIGSILVRFLFRNAINIKGKQSKGQYMQLYITENKIWLYMVLVVIEGRVTFCASSRPALD